MKHRLLAALALAALPLGAAAQDMGTPMHPVGREIALVVDSGVKGNPDKEFQAVWSQVIPVQNAAWIQVSFSRVLLQGDSFLRVTSLKDWESQDFNKDMIAMWNNATAYFNGSEVLIELYAGPETEGNQVVVSKVLAEIPGFDPRGDPGQCGICAGDNRVPSAQDWSGRLMPVGCTGSIYCRASTMVTAGHCLDTGTLVVHFRVPASTAGCATVAPPAADQFPVVNRTFVNGGVGNDWGVYTTGTNTLGQTAFHRYNSLLPLAAVPGSGTINYYGYGLDTNCVRSQTQQFSTGPITTVDADQINFNADVRGGNSGSGILNAAQNGIIGVLTHCLFAGCPNIGTRIDLAAYVAARNSAPYNICNSTLRLIAVNSSGAASVPITLSAADVNALQNGTSNFERVYVNNASINFTAPATASSLCFSRWVLNGTALVGNPVNVVMNQDHTLVAEYITCPTAPPNNNCASAIDVSAGGTFNGTLVNATNDGTASCGASSTNPDVWYRFTAPACPATLTVSTCGSHDANGNDTVLSLHTACGGAQLACLDDYIGSNPPCADTGTRRDSLLQRDMAAGETVFIRVSKFSSTASLPFVLNVSYGLGNDLCANAQPVSDGVFPFNTCAATTDGFNEAGFTCFNRQLFKDIWYSYISPVDADVTATTCGTVSFDTMLAAYTTCPAGVNASIACNDDSACPQGGLLSRITFHANAGVAILVRLGGFNNQSGAGVLTITSVPTGCSVTCDMNGDGGNDVADVIDLSNAIAGGTPVPNLSACKDYNQDGGEDVGDVIDLSNSIAGGTCP